MDVLNLGIVAHVDAGKTSLTERLLCATGVIDAPGRVDAGTTRTDTLALERSRGITIQAAVVSFRVGDRTVNLIDTPGHPDFIAEVERSLRVLDGALLVVSAVEGVQAQTRVLWRALRRLRIPTLIVVNKVDRRGAADEALLRRIADRLTPDVVPMTAVRRLGTPAARVRALDRDAPEHVERLVDVLTRHDDALLADCLRGGVPDPRRLRSALAAQTARALVHPVFLASAITGTGVRELLTGLVDLLPAAAADATGPPAGTVFAIRRGSGGERLAHVRMFGGTLRLRDRLRVHRVEANGPGGHGRLVDAGRVTGLSGFDGADAQPRDAVTAGQIAVLRGPHDVRVGDTFGDPARSGRGAAVGFPPPTLETVVLPRDRARRGALHAALTQLAEQDPLIDVRTDEVRGQLAVSLYGEVQKEVIAATLAAEHGLHVGFRPTTTICVERPAGRGAAAELIGTESNPFLATVGLRVEPGPEGSGVALRHEVELGSMPRAFFAAVQETVHAALGQGLYGWRVTDCVVTVTHSGYWARQSHAHGTFDKSMSSTAGDFRLLTPLVLLGALAAAGSTVCEPWHRFRLEAPAAATGPLMRALAGLRAIPDGASRQRSWTSVGGEIPAAAVPVLRRRLPGLSAGEGELETDFAGYRPVTGPVPRRPRTDHNPLDRGEYLRHVLRRT